MKTFFAWLVIASTAFAQDGPKAVITDSNGNPPPEKVVAGEVLYLSAAQAVTGEGPDSIIWLIEPKARAERARVFGKEICIPLGTVDCTLEVTQIVAKGDKPAWAKVTIEIDGKDVKPDPDPGPDPTPVPVDGLSALVVKHLKPVLDKPENQNLKVKFAFAALSTAYKQLASEIKSGAITKIDPLLDKTKAMTSTALGEFLPLWKGTQAAPGPIFHVETELEKRQSDLKSHESLYLEIAKGIDAALGV